MFAVGQKVVCVDASDTDGRLVKGRIYVIEKIWNMFDVWFLTFPSPENGGWWITRFRPLEEQKTDISVFLEILNRTKAPIV